jgi:hypothetical protein
MRQDGHRLRERYADGSPSQRRTDKLVRRITVIVAAAAIVLAVVSVLLLFGLDRLR